MMDDFNNMSNQQRESAIQKIQSQLASNQTSQKKMQKGVSAEDKNVIVSVLNTEEFWCMLIFSIANQWVM